MKRRSLQYLSAAIGRQEGFAMVEVIVAFTVLALGVGAILVGVATAMRSDARARNSRDMYRIAQARLEAAGIAGPLSFGRRDGRTGQFSWRETVVLATIGKGKKDKQPPAAGAIVVPVWVEIAVRDADGREEKLSALKLLPGGVR